MGSKKQFNLFIDEELIKLVRHSALEADDKVSDHVAGILETHFKRRAQAGEYVSQLLERLKSEPPKPTWRDKKKPG